MFIGAYELESSSKNPTVTLYASGSEVNLAISTKRLLNNNKISLIADLFRALNYLKIKKFLIKKRLKEIQK